MRHKKDQRGNPLSPAKKFFILDKLLEGTKDMKELAIDAGVSLSTAYHIKADHPLFFWREKE